jgi:hypothetical protein
MCTICEESNDMKISFFSSSSSFSSHTHISSYNIYYATSSNSNSRKGPNTATGCTYTLTNEETKLTAERSKHTSVTSTNQDERTLHFSC